MSKRNHSFVMMSKLSDVRGRVNYISSPERQEYLYAVYSTVEDHYWELLAEQNQKDFRRSGTNGKCIEGRELIIMLPPSLMEYDHEVLLKYITTVFTEKYDVGCCAALHHNKSKTNFHIHLIFSERKIQQEAEHKIASRNMFYNEKGKRVKTKKDILSAEGNVRQGCKIIQKGQIYDINFFQSYYTNVPYLKLSQNSISEALVYQELRENNKFLLESEKNIPNTRPYKGGYVKSPTKKVVKAVACIDAKSLYPNGIRTAGISPELKIDQIEVNEFGRPANIVEEQKWEKYKALGYGLSFMGRVYDMNTEGLFYKIETKLLNQRKIFKGHASDIYLNLIPKLEDKLKELDPDNNYFKKHSLV